MSSTRSLLSLGLQKDILAALTRNGYENLRDLNLNLYCPCIVHRSMSKVLLMTPRVNIYNLHIGKYIHRMDLRVELMQVQT
jgi:hypothetical protein